MKVLLVTSVYKNEVVGPARFARLLESSPLMDIDILTENVEETASLKSVDIKYAWWQKKLKIYFSINHFSKRILEMKDKYDVILYNSSVLADHHKIASPYIVMVNDEKLANLKFSFNFDFIRRSLHKGIEKKAVRNASKVIVNSNYLKYIIGDAYSVNYNKIHVLHKGISLEDKLSDFNDNLSSRKPIDILFVKNDFNLGGLPDLIDALGKLEKYTFNLSIIGTSSRVLGCLVNHQNLTYKILGYQSNEDVIKAMYTNDLLCIPSRFEPLGVAIMEGLAVGVPTITTGVGGLSEVTNNGNFVWECKPNNPQSIAEQINGCISNPVLRKEKSQSGKIYIHNKFDFINVVERLKNIISAVPPTF